MSNKADFCDKCSHWTPCAMDVKCLVCRYIGGIPSQYEPADYVNKQSFNALKEENTKLRTYVELLAKSCEDAIAAYEGEYHSNHETEWEMEGFVEERKLIKEAEGLLKGVAK